MAISSSIYSTVTAAARYCLSRNFPNILSSISVSAYFVNDGYQYNTTPRRWRCICPLFCESNVKKRRKPDLVPGLPNHTLTENRGLTMPCSPFHNFRGQCWGIILGKYFERLFMKHFSGDNFGRKISGDYFRR